MVVCLKLSFDYKINREKVDLKGFAYIRVNRMHCILMSDCENLVYAVLCA